MSEDKDAVYVKEGEKWSFNEGVADCFEDMLERSIPQYQVMRKAVFDLASYKIKDSIENGRVFSMLDIGCSDGLSLDSFVKKYGYYGRYLGVDTSEPMLKRAEDRFSDLVKKDVVKIQNLDLRKEFPKGDFDIITSVLCIMFTPIQYRQNIVQRVYDSLSSGGTFIMVEKVLGNTARIDDMMVDTYYAMKSDNGYSQEQIERKKMSLEGVQVPVTSNWNIDLLKQAGFRQIDVFWRWMNFEGYIAIK